MPKSDVQISSDAIRFLRTTTSASWGELIGAIRLTLTLVELVDEIEKTALRLRPLERKQEGPQPEQI